MEINTAPTRLLIAFDSLNRFSEKEHADAYIKTLKLVLEFIQNFLSTDAVIKIPETILRTAAAHGLRVDQDQGVTLSNAILIAEEVGSAFYYAEDYEIDVEVADRGSKYRLRCNSDPVVFQVDRI